MAATRLNYGIIRHPRPERGNRPDFIARPPKETPMNEDVFNTSIRRFLKTLGVTGQREIEKAVRKALADGKLKGNEKLQAQAVITIGAVQLRHEIGDTIDLS
jgi:hypothetical protein